MRIYQFRVSIIGIPKLYRLIEVSENCTFDDFHDAIFQAFDRYDYHLYSFFITRKGARTAVGRSQCGSDSRSIEARSGAAVEIIAIRRFDQQFGAG